MSAGVERSRRRLGVAGWAALLLASVACEPSGPRAQATRRPSTDDLSGFSIEHLEVRPKIPAAVRYGDALALAANPVELAVAARLTAAGLEHLPALSVMAHALVESTPDEVNVPPSLVDGLMAWAGLVHPPPRLVVVELGGDRAGCDARPGPACQGAIDSLVEQANSVARADDWAEGPETLRFGVGVVGLGGGRTRMMVALLQPAVSLQPIDVSVASGASVQLRGRLLGPRTQPYVEVVPAEGPGGSVAVALSVDGSFSGTVQCAADGAYQVEVLAEGPHGPEVAANFPVYCGVAPPRSLDVVLERVGPEVDAAQIARANFIYLNEERERHGLAPVAWDPDAAVVARKHSRDMHDNRFVGHRSPSSGDVTARFERGGLVGTVIRENVARGYGPKGIHDSLMRSPGHRINILAADVTHVGVGAVLGDAETSVPGAPRPVYATQNFYKKPGAGAPVDAQLAPTVVSRVDTLRREAGLAPLGWDDALSRLAAKTAAALARGRKPPADLDASVFALGFVSMETHQLASIDFDALTTVDLWRQQTSAAVGLGVARQPDTRTADGGFVAFVIVAQRP